MSLLKKFKLLFNNEARFDFLAKWGFFDSLSDIDFVKKRFKIKMGYPLNLDNPKTYNEKLQWLKLFDHNDLYTQMVDKYRVKEYVAGKIGDEFLIPTLGVWNDPYDIDFSLLPKSFVLKCTHDSGSIVFCKDKSCLDIKKTRNVLSRMLSGRFYKKCREWPYKNVVPRIIAEPYMVDATTLELRDYKFFVFDGCVKAMFVATDRQKDNEEVKFDFFDAEYNHLPIRQAHPCAHKTPSKPLRFDEMKKMASALAVGFPHVRVDFYEVDGHPYFGEFTFFHHGGWVPFVPAEWDYIFGEWLVLPSKKMITDNMKMQ